MMKDDDFKLLGGFDDKQTNEQTFVIVELLSRLKSNQGLIQPTMDSMKDYSNQGRSLYFIYTTKDPSSQGLIQPLVV